MQPALHRWHLLSLDAPTVAGVWACLLAHTAGLRPSLSATLVLVLGTWLVYVADRLLDAYRNSDPLLLRARHHFAMHRWRQFLAAGFVIGALMTLLILLEMSTRARAEDTLIFSAVMVYFAAVHGSRSHSRLPKELCVALLFAAATAVPAWSQIPFTGWQVSAPQLRLALAVALFAGVCLLNCLAIEQWEAGEPLNQEASGAGADRLIQRSCLTLWRGKGPSRVCAVAAFGVLALTLFSMTSAILQPLTPLLLSVETSALLFFMLDHRRDRLTTMQLRIAADLALLTPLLLAPAMILLPKLR